MDSMFYCRTHTFIRCCRIDTSKSSTSCKHCCITDESWANKGCSRKDISLDSSVLCRPGTVCQVASQTALNLSRVSTSCWRTDKSRESTGCYKTTSTGVQKIHVSRLEVQRPLNFFILFSKSTVYSWNGVGGLLHILWIDMDPFPYTSCRGCHTAWLWPHSWYD